MMLERTGKTSNRSLHEYGYYQFPLRLAGLLIAGTVLASCSTGSQPKQASGKSKEYFAESQYGVKASPRVSTVKGKPLPRGGGREQLGKPYKVRGKWYKPKEEPNYKKVGHASWYGSAFHGRLTANGEVYDMDHLTAAHPTMPLPSYARVTNLSNGRSLIVRVNDRGPFSEKRIIDLSNRAADMLDYTNHGTVEVKVEYVGKAPLHGQDDAFLLASYVGEDLIGQPASDVMMAMNDAPQGANGLNMQAMALQNEQALANAAAPFSLQPVQEALNIPLPLEKPVLGANSEGLGAYEVAAAISGYAPEMTSKNTALAGIYSKVLVDRQEVGLEAEYVDLGLFSSQEQVERLVSSLQSGARISRLDASSDNQHFYGLHAVAINGDNDALLRMAWEQGAKDAFVVRND